MRAEPAWILNPMSHKSRSTINAVQSTSASSVAIHFIPSHFEKAAVCSIQLNLKIH